MGIGRNARAPGRRRRGRLLVALGLAVAAALGVTILVLAPAAPGSASSPQLRTTFFTSMGEICDVELVSVVSPTERPGAAAAAARRLSALDLNALDSAEFVAEIQLRSPELAFDDIELLAVVEAATADLEATLERLGWRDARVVIGSTAECRSAARANESGEQAVDVSALLAGREPSELLAAADFEEFVVTSDGTVCEIALRANSRTDRADPGMAAVSAYLATIDLTTLPPPRTDGLVQMTAQGLSLADAEANAWLSAVVDLAFRYASEHAPGITDLSMEGGLSCDS